MARIADTGVLIVGGGPVGLFLGCCLSLSGIEFQIVEKRETPSRHTRSIGIHPPALELLARTGIADALIEHGVCVPSGIAFAGPKILGRLSFATCAEPYRFILAIPQYMTEAILRERLVELAPDALTPGSGVHSVREESECIVAELGGGESIRASLVVGCDGMRSCVRESAGFRFHGAEYPDHYAMGDYDDESGLGDEACVFLGRGGLVESFPLPGNVRRWVARDAAGEDKNRADIRDAVQLAEVVQERTGQALAADTSTMFSAFHTNAFLARPFARGRIFLAGDAGHVVSPIGGQGMNLGWLDVADLVPEILSVLAGNISVETASERYAALRSRAYHIVKRRSEFNMWMGREGRSSLIKQWMTRLVLGSPVSRSLAPYFADRFSMRGLPASVR